MNVPDQFNAKRGPRSKSVSSKPPNLQPRSRKTAGRGTTVPINHAAQKTNSATSLPEAFRKLSVADSKAGSRKTSGANGHTTCKSLSDVAQLILDNRVKNIVVMAGAGISTPSGIPDFRTPGTGLYDNLRQYNIPEPEAIFDLEYFETNPRPFYTLAKEIYPNRKYQPNIIHYFLRLLHEKGVLLRVYTQNIDGLERLAGIPGEKLVEAHGSFQSVSCIRCRQKDDCEKIKSAIFEGKIPRCMKNGCLGLVKPDIVFFGEDLPRRFYYYLKDFPQADLLLVLGTSLKVEPFAGIVDSTRYSTPRVLLNNNIVGPFKRKRRINDVVAKGDIAHQIRMFVDLLNWTKSLKDLLPAPQESSKSDDDTSECKRDNSSPTATDMKAPAKTSVNGTSSVSVTAQRGNGYRETRSRLYVSNTIEEGTKLTKRQTLPRPLARQNQSQPVIAHPWQSNGSAWRTPGGKSENQQQQQPQTRSRTNNYRNVTSKQTHANTNLPSLRCKPPGSVFVPFHSQRSMYRMSNALAQAQQSSSGESSDSGSSEDDEE